MEAGDLGDSHATCRVFVFDGLVGHLGRPRLAKAAMRFRRWDLALEAWVLDLAVLKRIERLVALGVAADVMTWQPGGFAGVLSKALLELRVPVRTVYPAVFEYIAADLAMDRSVTAVYDPDSAHGTSYGFKARDLRSEADF